MKEILIAFAMSQCSHYAEALATDSPDIEVLQIACAVTSEDAYGSPLVLKECYKPYFSHKLSCIFEVKEDETIRN